MAQGRGKELRFLGQFQLLEAARPALVISPDSFNEQGQDVVLIAITSQEPHDNAVTIEEQDCVDGELPKKSFVKLSKLFTVHSTPVLKKICALRGEKLDDVLLGLQGFFS